ncbi:MAG: FG-GAP-like repeat-containing protein [Planctomycetota bacterium]
MTAMHTPRRIGLPFLLAGLAAPTVAQQPDLQVTITTASDPVRTLTPLTVIGRVSNAGGSAAPATLTAVYFSLDATITADDPLLAVFTTPPLASGADAPFRLDMRVPADLPWGQGRLAVVADHHDLVDEANETNNIALRTVRSEPSIDGDADFQNLGEIVTAAGDVNGDGYDDIVASRDNGVLVISGLDRSRLFTIPGGNPVAIAGGGDIDGDGRDDIVVTEGNGNVRLIALASAGEQTLTGDPAAGFGRSLAFAGDVDADGYDDVIVGSPLADVSANNAGRVQVYSGRDGHLIRTIDGLRPSEQFGTSVDGAGDVDGDGFDDVIAGAPAAGAGRARVYSVRTGRLLHELRGENAGDGFGDTVVGLGDSNGDGVGDLLVSAPSDGLVKVFSGADGSELLRLANAGNPVTAAGDVNGDRIPDFTSHTEVFSGRDGRQLASFPQHPHVVGVGDLNQDGFDDLAAADPLFDGTGRDIGRVIPLYDPLRSLQRDRTFSGAATDDRAGHALAHVGDIDADGIDDLLMGVPFDDQRGPDAGCAKVLSGATGATIFTFFGDAPGDEFGWSVAAAPGVSGRAPLDFVVGSRSGGYVRVFHGDDGRIATTFRGSAAHGYGICVAGVGDADNDGRGDVAIGAPTFDPGTGPTGMVEVRSGRTGAVLRTFRLPDDQVGAEFGFAVAGVVRGGRSRVLIGAPRYDRNGLVDCGVWTIYDSNSGMLTDSEFGQTDRGRLGQALCRVPDLDGDGIDDFLAGEPGWPDATTAAGRALLVRSSPANAPLVVTGDAGQALGTAVCVAGDVDGDGTADFAAGGFGTVRVVSGHTGRLLRRLDDATPGEFGSSLAGGAHLDHDRRADLWIGTPFGRAAQAGIVSAYVSPAGADPGIITRFGRGCPGSQGRLPRADMLGLPQIGSEVAWVLGAARANTAAAVDVGVASWELPLDFLGAIGCVHHAQPILRLWGTTDNSGRLSWRLQVPANTDLVGFSLFLQWLVVDPGVNPAGVVTTNGIVYTHGRPQPQ